MFRGRWPFDGSASGAAVNVQEVPELRVEYGFHDTPHGSCGSCGEVLWA
jgi:hypothetical protein